MKINEDVRWVSEKEAREENFTNRCKIHFQLFKNQEKRERRKIPYAGRVFDENELCCLAEACLDFWLTGGRFTETFEKSFSEYLGVPYVSFCNSGSFANLLAFAALTAPELGERRIICRGDEVITVAAAFPTTVTPILQYGAVPVFLDITVPQYNIDVSRLEEARTKRTKAVFVAPGLNDSAIDRMIRSIQQAFF